MTTCKQIWNAHGQPPVPARPARRFRRSVAGRLVWHLLVALPLAAGCNDQEARLQVQDLGPGERYYVTRMVTLERAKAVALADSAAGRALLDSLARAWGDSSLDLARRAASRDPARSQAVNQLLLDLLEAERDSFLLAPRPDRLSAPLPPVGSDAGESSSSAP